MAKRSKMKCALHIVSDFFRFEVPSLGMIRIGAAEHDPDFEWAHFMNIYRKLGKEVFSNVPVEAIFAEPSNKHDLNNTVKIIRFFSSLNPSMNYAIAWGEEVLCNNPRIIEARLSKSSRKKYVLDLFKQFKQNPAPLQTIIEATPALLDVRPPPLKRASRLQMEARVVLNDPQTR